MFKYKLWIVFEESTSINWDLNVIGNNIIGLSFGGNIFVTNKIVQIGALNSFLKKFNKLIFTSCMKMTWKLQGVLFYKILHKIILVIGFIPHIKR